MFSTVFSIIGYFWLKTIANVLCQTDSAEQNTENMIIQTKIFEEHPIGQVILQLEDELKQYDEKNGRTFDRKQLTGQIHLLPTHDAAYFRINPDGSLTNVRRLNYEELCSVRGRIQQTGSTDITPQCTLQIKAIVYENISVAGPKENGQYRWKRRLRSITVLLNLMDVNDNRPSCVLNDPHVSIKPIRDNSPLIEVSESTPVGTIVASWTITDPDTRNNGVREARLFGQKNELNSINPIELPFQVSFDSSDGPWSKVRLNLVVTGRLEYSAHPDRSSVQTYGELDTYNLKVVLLDSKYAENNQGSQTALPLSGSTVCNIRVRILDVNDHDPHWVSPLALVHNEPIELNIFEDQLQNQKELVRLVAKDADRGANAKITYKWAMDDANLTSTYFEPSLVTEDSAGVREFISNFLILDPNSGSIQLRGATLDYEVVKQYFPLLAEHNPGRIPIRLRVVAVDQPLNQSQQSASPIAHIILWLIDVNDNAPSIEVIGLQPNPLVSTSYTKEISAAYAQRLYISENLPPREPVAFVTVTDQDSAVHGEVNCILVNDGTTTTGTEFSTQAFQLIKVAADGKISPALSSSPMFEGSITYSEETVRSKSSINYQLLAMKRMDREKQGIYRMNITCSDGNDDLTGQLPSFQHHSPVVQTSTKPLEVVITDMNDNAPKILGAFSEEGAKGAPDKPGQFDCFIKEHAITGTRVCQMRATDPDENAQNMLQWSLDESVENLLKIERNTGWISVKHSSLPGGSDVLTSALNSGRFIELDREKISKLTFTVFVKDSIEMSGNYNKPLTASATVTLHIIDVNDQVPKIPEYIHFEVSEAAKPGTIIGTLTAVDEDQPGTPNSAILYRMASVHLYRDSPTGSKSGLIKLLTSIDYRSEEAGDLRDITLDQKTGEIRVSSHGLDRERQPSYKFIVTVWDGEAIGGLPALPQRERHYVHTLVHITVTDENDNPPRIIYPEKRVATFVISCAAINHLPHTIAQLAVNDSDTGMNAEVLFFLSPMDIHGTLSGFRNMSNIDRPVYEQKTGPPNSSVMISQNHTRIEGGEKGASSKNFTKPGISTTVPDDQRSVTLLPFQIDSQSGLLTMVVPPEGNVCKPKSIASEENRPPNPTGLAEYHVKVVATDRGVPTLSSSVILIVRVAPTPPKVSNQADGANEVEPPNGLSRGRIRQSTHTNRDSAYSPVFDANNVDEYDGFSNIDQVDQTGGSQYMGTLNSPDVFWAAAICLTIATGVLIFLLILIIMITCRRRGKMVHLTGLETQQNEWAAEASTFERNTNPNCASQYNTHDHYSDDLEMGITKSSSPLSSEKFSMLTSAPRLISETGFMKSRHFVGAQNTNLADESDGRLSVNYSPFIPAYSISKNQFSSGPADEDPMPRRAPPRMMHQSPPEGGYNEEYQKILPTWRRMPEKRDKANLPKVEKLLSPRNISSDCSVVHYNPIGLMQNSYYSEEDLRKAAALSRPLNKTKFMNRSKTPPVEAASETSHKDIQENGGLLNISGTKQKNEVSFV